MAAKKQRTRGKVAPAPTPSAKPPAAEAPARSRDLRPLIYFVLNQIFVVIYAYVLIAVIPNRHASAIVHLWALPVLLQIMAIGTLMGIAKSEAMRRIGWRIGVVAGSGMLLVTVLLIVRVLVSAAFLSGVYGSFGKAAALSALIGVCIVVEIVALIPLFQVKYLMTRAGRRTYAMLPT